MIEPKLVRSETERAIAGVCGGIAAYLGIDVVLVRIAFILLSFASGIGVLSYLLLMIIMPSAANQDKPAGSVLKDNIDEYGDLISDTAERAAEHPKGPQIGAVIFIMLGISLLVNNFGWLGDGGPGWLFAIMLVGAGVYLVARRSSK